MRPSSLPLFTALSFLSLASCIDEEKNESADLTATLPDTAFVGKSFEIETTMTNQFARDTRVIFSAEIKDKSLVTLATVTHEPEVSNPLSPPVDFYVEVFDAPAGGKQVTNFSFKCTRAGTTSVVFDATWIEPGVDLEPYVENRGKAPDDVVATATVTREVFCANPQGGDDDDDEGDDDDDDDSTGPGDDDDDDDAGDQCGNDIREGAEECDGVDFGEAACPEGKGMLACNDDCTLDESMCGGIAVVDGDYLLADDDAQMQFLKLEDGVPEAVDHRSFSAFASALAGAPGEGYMVVGGRFAPSGNPPFVAFAAEDRVFANVSPPDGFAAEETLVDVAYGGGVWVAIGRDGSIRTDDHGMTWAYSPDPADLGFREELAYGDGAFVLARGDYSTDGGATWSISTEPPFNGAAYDAAIGYGGGRFVAVGREGPSGLGGSPYSCISEDAGGSWSCSLLPFAEVGSLSTTAAVVYGDGRWVFGGQHLPYILRFSDDGGETWTTADFPIVDDDAMISDITYKPEVGFLATVEVGFADSAILHSADGEIWTQVGEVLTDTRYVGAASIP